MPLSPSKTAEVYGTMFQNHSKILVNIHPSFDSFTSSHLQKQTNTSIPHFRPPRKHTTNSLRRPVTRSFPLHRPTGSTALGSPTVRYRTWFRAWPPGCGLGFAGEKSPLALLLGFKFLNVFDYLCVMCSFSLVLECLCLVFLFFFSNQNAKHMVVY